MMVQMKSDCTLRKTAVFMVRKNSLNEEQKKIFSAFYRCGIVYHMNQLVSFVLLSNIVWFTVQDSVFCLIYPVPSSNKFETRLEKSTNVSAGSRRWYFCAYGSFPPITQHSKLFLERKLKVVRSCKDKRRIVHKLGNRESFSILSLHSFLLVTSGLWRLVPWTTRLLSLVNAALMSNQWQRRA